MLEQEITIPEMKLQSMVYQLMRLCEKLEAGGDRGIQRDLELRATIESLNETITELNQVGPLLENSVKETTKITANKIYNHLLGEIKKAIEQQMLEACYKLRTECDRVETVVNHNEKLTEKIFLLYMAGAVLVGMICGGAIMFKFLT
jgi:capsular polysaccharide biosynthesis protein